MEIKEIRVGQIVIIEHYTDTQYKVLEIRGGKASLCEVLRPENKLVANISNLILLVNS